MIEIVLYDGSRYMIDTTLIACVCQRKYGAIGDDQSKKACFIYWMGGGSVQINGADYDEVIRLWRKNRMNSYEPSYSTPEHQGSGNGISRTE